MASRTVGIRGASSVIWVGLFAALAVGCASKVDLVDTADVASDVAADGPLDGSDVGDGSTDGGGDVAKDSAAKDTAVMDLGPALCIDKGVVSSALRTCVSADDCVLKLHIDDCCGNSTWIGVAKTSESGFDTCEADYRAALPKCGCPAMPPKTEDGETIKAETEATVSCLAGSCRTAKKKP